MGGASTKVATVLLNKRLDGKVAVVTGSNTGIGKITVKQLYRLGARVILACRDVSKAHDAVNDIKNDVASEDKLGELIVRELNLSSLASVRKCASEINDSEEAIHLLINNAGVMMHPQSKTEDGFETHFGVNHLGHFLFTCLLLPKIIKSAPSKIISVSSSAHEKGQMVWDDLFYEKRAYSPLGAYCQSKLANILFSKELANRLKDSGVFVYSVHPGIVTTELGRYVDQAYFRGARLIGRIIFYPFFISPEEGARTAVYCALMRDDGESGTYWSECHVKEPSAAAQNLEDAKRLWEESAKMVQLDFDPFDAK